MLLQSRQVLLVRNMSELIHRLNQLQTKIDSLFNNEFCFSYFNPCLFYHSHKLKTDFFWVESSLHARNFDYYSSDPLCCKRLFTVKSNWLTVCHQDLPQQLTINRLVTKTLYLSAGLICDRINQSLWPLFSRHLSAPSSVISQVKESQSIDCIQQAFINSSEEDNWQPLWVCHHKLGERWQQLCSQCQSDTLKMFRCELCNFSPLILLFVSFAFSSMDTNPPWQTAGQISKYTQHFFPWLKTKKLQGYAFKTLC